MTAPRPDTPPADADRRLRHSLRQALEQAPDEGQQALQARLLQQWREQQTAPAPPSRSATQRS